MRTLSSYGRPGFPPPRVLASLTIVVMALACMACRPDTIEVTDAGCPVWRGSPIYGLALPWTGPLYFCGQESDPSTRKHEEYHIRRMEEAGAMLWTARYLLDPEFGCQEERMCGFFGKHPR